MNNNTEYNAVLDILNRYFEGLYQADSTILSTVFHRDARYINTVKNDYMNYSMKEYFHIVDQREAPSLNNEARADNIFSIAFEPSLASSPHSEIAPRMAFAQVSMTMLGRHYNDFLTLTIEDKQWKIISKVFSYTPLNF